VEERKGRGSGMVGATRRERRGVVGGGGVAPGAVLGRHCRPVANRSRLALKQGSGGGGLPGEAPAQSRAAWVKNGLPFQKFELFQKRSNFSKI
jgi:hypothetical protein